MTEKTPPPRWQPRNVVVAFVALAFVAVVLFFGRRTADRSAPDSPLVVEAMNDHLRVLGAAHPLEIESAAMQQVKPWLESHVGFAPQVAFDGDADFPLQGGLIAYYIDRRAACFVYERGLHPITLLVFQARDLPWPRTDRIAADTRGLHAIVWRSNDLGYALVSDAALSELVTLEHKVH